MVKNKLHCCCGDVYLTGYWNVDINSIDGESILAADTTDEERAINETTVDEYYKYDLGQNPTKKVIADEFVDLREWPYGEEQFDEIVIINAFEHFSKVEAEKLVEKFHMSLKPNGKLFLDVPDVGETIRQVEAEEMDVDFAMRHIYGSYKNNFNIHRYGYTAASLAKLLTKLGFSVRKRILIEHCFPSIALEATKEEY